MKKIIVLFVLSVVAAFSFFACSSSSGPEAVAEKFTRAIYTGDFEKAKSFCTEDGTKMIGFIELMLDKDKVDKLKASKPIITPGNAVIEDNGNTAMVKVMVKGVVDLESGEVKDEQEDEIKLVMNDGKWLVDYSK